MTISKGIYYTFLHTQQAAIYRLKLKLKMTTRNTEWASARFAPF